MYKVSLFPLAHVRLRIISTQWKPFSINSFLANGLVGGGGGPIEWPPRLSDLNPVEFFLCGYVKDLVYQSKVQDVD
jgi:hypothetical protein